MDPTLETNLTSAYNLQNIFTRYVAGEIRKNHQHRVAMRIEDGGSIVDPETLVFMRREEWISSYRKN